MHRVSILPVATLALIASACGVAPKAPSTQLLEKDDYSLVADYLKVYIPARMRKNQLTGLSVAIVDDQTVIWSDGFGFSDKSDDTKASESTVYKAGSVSKLFTAMAVMKLAENQQVDIDAPIKNSVPTFDLKTRFGSIDKITLRNILSHHAGIPSAIHDGMWSNEPDSYKTANTKLNRYYAAFPTDTVFAYSNAGYSVAGQAVENTSGLAFVDYLETALLQPLEMIDSNFRFDITHYNVSRSYRNGQKVQELGLRDLPAGGLVTTVGDLSNLVKLVHANGFFKSQLFMPTTMQKMLSVQTSNSVYEPVGFNGIGWFHFSRFLDNKYTVVGHSGQTMAHSALVTIVPDIKLGVVLLSNSPSNGALEEITDEILRMAHVVKTRKSISEIGTKNKDSYTLPGIDTSFDGHYSSIFGYLDIRGKADNYLLRVDGTRFKLSRNRVGGHSLKAQLLGFIPFRPPGIGDLSFFVRDVSDDKMIFAQRSNGQTSLIATQIKPQKRNPAWDARLGSYTLTNPIPTDYELFVIDGVELTYSNGFYHFNVEGPVQRQTLPLSIINESQATLQGYGRGLGETVFAEPDGSLLHAGWAFARNR